MATPHLSYYFGRRVVGVETGPTDEDYKWQIVFEPEVRVRNLAEAVEIPDSTSIIGSALLTGEIVPEVSTLLRFGFSHPPTLDDPDGSITVAEEVTFPFEGYEIYDPALGEDYSMPDAPVMAEDTLPPDPSDARVASGPS